MMEGTRPSGLGAETSGRKNTPSPPMPPLQTKNFDWQRPDKYPTSSPDDGSASEKYFPNYSSLYSSPVSGSTDGPSSAVTFNQVHPWLAGGLGEKEGEGRGMGRMAMVREQSGDDIELQRMEPKVDVDFIQEAGKRGFTTSPVVETHQGVMI